MKKKKKKKSKKKVKKVKKSKSSIIDNLKIVEKNFLLNYKLSGPMDKAGILTLSVNFKNKYGATRYSSLGLTERGLYNVTCLIQGRAKAKKSKKKGIGKKKVRKTAKKRTTKKKGKKRSLQYTPAECEWFKKYKIPKVFGEKEQAKLAREHRKEFPGLLRRTPDALAWQVMHRQGRWNPKRKPGEEPKKIVKKTKKRTTKRRRRLIAGRKHRYTPDQENYLMLRIPKSRNFRHGELRKITRAFNAAFRTNLNYKVIGIKCSRLRKKLRGITKAELRKVVAADANVMKEALEAEDKMRAATLVPSKAPKVSVPASDAFIVVDLNDNKRVIWEGDHEPKNICVCGGVSQKDAVCTVIIDDEVLPIIFKDHKPELKVYRV